MHLLVKRSACFRICLCITDSLSLHKFIVLPSQKMIHKLIRGCFSYLSFLNLSSFAHVQLGPLQVDLILPTTRHAKYPANICEVGPAIKWAVEHVNAQYSNELDLAFKYLEQPNVQSCEDLTSEMGNMLAKYYYSPRREKRIAVFGPFDGCTEAQTLLQMSAGWNSLAILGVATLDKTMFTLYPNFVLTAGLDILSITTHFVIMMRTYRWTMCYMILDAGDTMTASSSGGGLATVVAGVRAMGQAIGGTVVLRFINSSEPRDIFEQNVRVLLQEVQTSARVLSLGVKPNVVRSFMLVASSVNMTNGDYVYYTLNLGAESPEWGSLEWQKSDTEDEIAFQAYRSLLVQSFSSQTQDNDTDIFLTELKDRGCKEVFPECRQAPHPRKDSAYPVTAYISTHVLAQVLVQAANSSSSAFVQELSTRGSSMLVEYFRNRSFRTPAGTVYFDKTGARRSGTTVDQYDPATRKITAVWLANPLKFGMEQIHEPFWLLGHAPSNAPLCGYREELCQEEHNQTTVQAASSVTVVVVLLIGLVTVLEWRKKRNEHHRQVFQDFLLDAPLGRRRPALYSVTAHSVLGCTSHYSLGRARLFTNHSDPYTHRHNFK